MLAHLLKSINWIDAAFALLFIRMIFAGVKNGFIFEFFKFFGVVVAVFVSLHYYSTLAAWIAWKTNMYWPYWDFVVFASIWLAVGVFFKYFRDSVLTLFKVETTHEGFDKYAAGVVAIGRGLLVCSLTIFLILLAHYGPLSRATLSSCSYKISARAAVSTYRFLYINLIDKLFAQEHYNAAAAQVMFPMGKY